MTGTRWRGELARLKQWLTLRIETFVAIVSGILLGALRFLPEAGSSRQVPS